VGSARNSGFPDIQNPKQSAPDSNRQHLQNHANTRWRDSPSLPKGLNMISDINVAVYRVGTHGTYKWIANVNYGEWLKRN
jgi:hypothetical protein